MKAFNIFQAEETAKIQRVGDRIVGGGPVVQTGQRRGELNRADVLLGAIGNGRVSCAVRTVKAKIDAGEQAGGIDVQILVASSGRSEIFRSHRIIRGGG